MNADVVPRRAIAAISGVLRLDPQEAEPVPASMHTVLRFRRAGAVVRFTATPSGDHRLVRVAAALAAAGVPVVRLLPDVPQPVEAHGWSATAWRLLPAPPAARFPAADLAGPLSALHTCRPPDDLPAWDLLGAVRERTAQPFPAPAGLGLSTAALRSRLLAVADEIAAELNRTTWRRLAPTTVHGDAHTGNLLRDPELGPVLCDLDTVSWGPPEADLTPAAHGVWRFGRDPADYERLAAAYGFDVRTAPGWPALRRLRDLQLAVYRLAGPPPGDELGRRIRTVLADDDAARWHRFAGGA